MEKRKFFDDFLKSDRSNDGSQANSVFISKAPFYQKDPKRTKLLYSCISPILEKYSSADICIICDFTGSMDRYVEIALQTINKIFDDFKHIFIQPPRFSFIGFKDKNDKQQIYKHDFTLDNNELKSFIEEIECEGGDDDCEDIVTPMKEALYLSWRSDCLLVCMILDSPTHGASYHNATESDKFPGDDKEQLLEKLCSHYRSMRINLVILKCNNSVDLMITKMKPYYESRLNKLIVIDLQKEENELKEKFMEAIPEKISKGLSKSVYSNFRKITVLNEIPQLMHSEIEDAIKQSFKCQLYSGMFDHQPVYEALKYDYNLKLQKVGSPMEFFIALSPRATGTFKACHDLFSKSGIDDRFVAKIPLSAITKASDLVADIEGNIFASHFSITFNTLLNQNVIKILPLYIVEILDDSYKNPMFNGSKFFVMQKCLDGQYIKYNNNYGSVNAEDKSQFNDLAQAFSHFTYEASMGTLLFVDIQGVATEISPVKSCFYLTDPAIHSSFYKGHFGITNHGKFGCIKFFHSHICNDFCKRLMLTNPKSLDKDELAKIHAIHSGNTELKHLYDGFEGKFKKYWDAIKNPDLKRKPTLEIIKEEDNLKETIIMNEYVETCRESKDIDELFEVFIPDGTKKEEKINK